MIRSLLSSALRRASSCRYVKHPPKPLAIDDHEPMPKYYCKIRYMAAVHDGT
jgi:hypothetical protein